MRKGDVPRRNVGIQGIRDGDEVLHGGRKRPCMRSLSWSKGRAESQGSGWTQGPDNSFIIMILPVHPARVFFAHGRKGVGMQRELKIGVSLPIPPRRVSVCLPARLPAGLLRDLEEGSRPSLLPMASVSAFVCLAALLGQEEATGPGNNGSFSGSARLPRSDRGRGTVARRRAQPPSAAATTGTPPLEIMGSTGGMWGDLPQPISLLQAPKQALVPPWRGDEGPSRVGTLYASYGGDKGGNTGNQKRGGSTSATGTGETCCFAASA